MHGLPDTLMLQRLELKVSSQEDRSSRYRFGLKGRCQTKSCKMRKYAVLLASFLVMFTTGSSSYASGVFHVGLQEKFTSSSVTLLVWAASVFLCMCGPAAFMASFVVNAFDCRRCVFLSGILGLCGFTLSFFVEDAVWLVLTYGIIAGSSLGFATVGGLVVLGFYFTDNVHVATSIAMSGQALGMFGHPPLCQYLIDTFGVKGTFLIYGGLAANGCVCAMVMKPNDLEVRIHGLISSGGVRNVARRFFIDQCSNYKKALNNKSYTIILIAYTTFGMSISISYIYLPEFFQIYGASKQTTSLCLAMTGIGSMISRLLTGILCHEKSAGPLLIFSCGNGIVGVITLFVFAFTTSTSTILLYGLLFGLYTGCTWTLLSPLSLEILGLELSASGIGFLLLAAGLGNLVGSPLSKIIFDFTGVHYHLFFFAGCTFAISSMCGFLSTVLMKRNSSVAEEEKVSSRDLQSKDQQSTRLVKKPGSFTMVDIQD